MSKPLEDPSPYGVPALAGEANVRRVAPANTLDAMNTKANALVWYLLESDACPAAENMALDETLLQTAPLLGRPLLRFYRWAEAAATFGYSQKFAVVERITALRPLLRRPTGGGLVPHDADWTYSLVFPPTHSWYQLRAVESYERLHRWVQAAFHKVGAETELASESCKESPGQCFIGEEPFDVIWKGRKIAGAAQRRTRQGFLIQGSIQAPAHLVRADWQTAFCQVAQEQWEIQWLPTPIDPMLHERVSKLVQEKYSRREYNERR